MFRIFFSSHGTRAFENVPQDVKDEIIQELESVADDALWYRRVKKLRGSENRYRLRVGRWRILFLLGGKDMEVRDVFLKKGKEDYRRRV